MYSLIVNYNIDKTKKNKVDKRFKREIIIFQCSKMPCCDVLNEIKFTLNIIYVLYK